MNLLILFFYCRLQKGYNKNPATYKDGSKKDVKTALSENSDCVSSIAMQRLISREGTFYAVIESKSYYYY